MNAFEEKIPMLGFGLMRLPKQEGGGIDMARTIEMVDYYMENGMNYFDTAYMYHDGESEPAFKTAVSDRYERDAYMVATKLPIWMADKQQDVERIFNDQLKKTGVEYFDFYMHHCITPDNHKKTVAFDGYEFVKRMKAEGKIRHIGFSFHGDAANLREVLETRPEMEFVQLQINYLDWDDFAREFYDIARSFNKPVIIMEPVKGGTLANLPLNLPELLKKANPDVSAASWAIRFCASLEGVVTILSGMSNMEQMKDNVRHLKQPKPLTPDERKVIGEAVAAMRGIPTVPCTECKYCAECPAGIPIFDIFKLYNKFAENKSLNGFRDKYGKIPEGSRADKCVKCGQCEGVCPQAIDIVSRLEHIAGMM